MRHGITKSVGIAVLALVLSRCPATVADLNETMGGEQTLAATTANSARAGGGWQTSAVTKGMPWIQEPDASVWDSLWTAYQSTGECSQEIVERYGLSATGEYREKLTSPIREERQLALRAMVMVNDQSSESREMIYESFHHPDTEFRIGAMQSCRVLKPPIHTLFPYARPILLNSDENTRMRIFTAITLGSYSDKTAVTGLLQALDQIENRDVMRAILLQLGNFKEHRPVIVPVLERFLDHEDSRMWLGAALSLIRLEAVTEALPVKLLQHIHDPFDDRGASFFRILSACGEKAFPIVPDLVTFAEESEPLLARQAALCLLRIDPESEQIRNLCETMQLDPKRASTQLTMTYLESVGHQDALPIIFKALEHPDRKVHRPAAIVFRYLPLDLKSDYEAYFTELLEQHANSPRYNMTRLAWETFGKTWEREQKKRRESESEATDR